MKNSYLYLLQNSLKYGKGVRFYIYLNILICIVSYCIRLLEPYIFGEIINVIQLNKSNLLNELFFWIFLFFIIIVIVRAIFVFSDYLRAYTGFKIAKNFKESMYNKLLNISLSWHNANHSGKTINQINTASDSIYRFNETHHQTISMIIYFFGPTIALFLIDYRIGIAGFLGGLFIFLNSLFFDKYIKNLHHEIINKKSKVNSVFFDYVANIGTIITLGIGKLTKNELSHQIDNSFPPAIKSCKINIGKRTLYDFQSQALVALCLLYYCYDIISAGGTILIGSLTMIYTYLQSMKSAFFNFNNIYNQLMIWQAEVESVDYILGEKDFYISSSKDNSLKWSEININNLNFSYDFNNSKLNLNNINIKIKNKSKIAFIGESGSGKSTMLKVIKGLYKINSGFISIDGEGKDFSILSNISTLIPQEPELFENTILYNISLGTIGNHDKVLDMIKLAQFENVLKKLPNGIFTNINEKGVNLSGGEKQRLALARGLFFIDDSDLVLLDEPTSSVDSLNELKIYENIFHQYNNKTIISVVHRLHLLKYFDYIYFFDNGHIICEGTLENLLLNEKFKNIWDKNK